MRVAWRGPMPGKPEKTSTNFLIGSGNIGMGSIYVSESGFLVVKFQLYASERAVAVFGNNNFRHILFFRAWIGNFPIFAINKQNYVGILFNGTGFAQIRQARNAPFSLLYSSGKLGKGDDWHI